MTNKDNSKIKFSIITINLNNKAGLFRTIESVVSQTYTDFEYIVIDGASTDGSKEIIQQYADQIDYWVSEPDTGIYQAMNKGISVSRGQYILFLNSGDYLLDSNVLLRAAYLMNDKAEVDVFAGNLLMSIEGKKVLIPAPVKVTFATLVSSYVPHPSSFISRKLFLEFGFYNEKNKIASDWEFFLRSLSEFGSIYRKLDLIITCFEEGGISSDKKFEEIQKNEKISIIKKMFPEKISDFIIEYNSIYNIINGKRFKLLMDIEQVPFLRWSLLLIMVFLSFMAKIFIKIQSEK